MVKDNEILAALNQLTDDLGTLCAQYPSLEDTAVRDVICGVLQNLLISGNRDVKIPIFFGIFHPGANLSLHRVLKDFLTSNAVAVFVASYDEDERDAILKEMHETDQIVSRMGITLTEILGEWA